MVATISRTDLARKTREIVDQVQRGNPVVVESYGEEQIVLLDIGDYRILQALAGYTTKQPSSQDIDQIIWDYLDENINLGKAAELLNMSRYELMGRFERLGVPLRIGPASIDEAQQEIDAARKARKSDA